jgi:hypothetical protein
VEVSRVMLLEQQKVESHPNGVLWT